MNDRWMKVLTAGLMLGLGAPAIAQNEAGLTATMDAAPVDAYADGPDEEGFESFASRVCYAIGANIGNGLTEQFAQTGMDFDADSFVEAFRAAAGDGETRLEQAQVEATLMEFQQRMQSRMMEQMMAQAEENAAIGAAFLAKNAEREGVQTTDSGLQYVIETLGDGPTPGPGDTVLVHYEGTLLDGTVFDSSIQRGEPAPFPMDQVIPGFSEGLALMPVGSEGTIYIPGEMAYGINPPQGSGIGLNETLTFKVQVIELVEDVEDSETP